MGVGENFQMKRPLIVVFSAVNFMLAYLAFIRFLNWYDIGQFDFSGRKGMVIGGAVFGVAFTLWQINRHRSVRQENSLPYFARHVLTNGIGLICSFAFGYLVDLLVQVKDITAVMAIFPTILMIPLLAGLNLVMMIPFALYLGITNGFLSRMVPNLSD